jgi:filamentous hemagglutinin family protein
LDYCVFQKKKRLSGQRAPVQLKTFGKGGNVMNKKSASRRPRRQAQHRLKPVYAAVLLAFSVQTAQANPIGGSVVNGSASFATAGNTLTVTNTPGTIINWQGFSINSNEITNFAQQSASSTVLNRVVGSDPSNIMGTLRSNGRVFLVNPNGIMFGAGAVVDVAGLVASTLNLSNADFLAGNNHFTQVPGAGNISNAGNITAQQGGQIYLIAPNVENTGVITAPNGEILLAAGYSVDLVSTDDPNLRVNITAPAGDATNVGQLVASAGSLGLFGTVVSNSGIVSADSAALQGGKIVFKASQSTEISGTVSANGTTGGNIEVLGNQVSVIDGATVSANGTQGGGTVLIGGDAHGANPDVPNAQLTYVAPTASISADALQSGDGGKVVVWADGATQFGGNISARGGAVSGNGGWVEVSGKQWLSYEGLVNTTAPYGLTGTLLLDPSDITITVLGTNNVTCTGTVMVTCTGPGAGSILLVSTLIAQLGSSNVIVDTTGTGGTGNITVADSIAWTSPNSLTLNATGTGTIGVNTNTTAIASVQPLFISSTGGGSLIMQTADGSIGVLAAAGVTITGGGSFTANAGGATSDVIINSVINTGAGAINLTAGQSVTELTGGSLTTTGLLTTKSAISTTLDGTNSVGSFAATNTGGGSTGIISLNNTAANWTLLGISQTSAGAVTLTNSGIITPTGAVSTGTFTLTGGTWEQVSATLPGFTASTGFNITGATFIRALGGDGVNTPYQLADIYGVQGIGSVGMLGNSYVLANNIDASVTAGWLNANGSPVGFVPIGVAYPGISFTGQFDGQGHTISNLYINQPGVNDVGLFGYASSGSISNVGLVNVSVSGASNVGGLVGSNYYGNISNSYVSGGTISATGNNVGGLVGNYSNSTGGTISNSYVYNGTKVTGASNVGGLVGNSQYGSIRGSHVDGVTVTGTGSAIGGLVGNNNSSFDGGSGISIMNSYVNNGTVSGASSVGGLAGSNSGGKISGSSVNSGTVSATGNYAGGLIGNNKPNSWGNISSSNVTGVGVTGGSYVGGLIGFNGTGIATGTGSSVGNTITGSYVSGGTVSASGSNVGGLVGSNAGSVSGSYDNGTTVTSSTGDTSVSAGGLVGSNSGTINNSYATNFSVSDNATIAYDLGGLVGNNTGTISTSYASNGTVSSKSAVGGLVGNNSSGGTIDTSFASNNTVSGNNTIGGLVGSNSGSISNTFASGGTISGSSTVGGLVGYDTGSISTSYASVSISAGGTNVGGLVGYTYGGTFSNNFWNTTTETGVTNGIGFDGITSLPSNSNAIGMSDADMKTLANFNSATAANGNVNPNWDISASGSGTIWRISEGLTMPELSFFPATAVASSNVINELVDITDQRPKRNEVDVLVASTAPGDSGNQQTLPMCN